MKESITKIESIISSIVVAILFIVLWSIISNNLHNELIYPSIKQIFDKLVFILTSKSHLKSILFTILRVLLSVFISLVIGIIISCLYVICPKVKLFFNPIITVMRSLPIAIISIFIFLLLGAKIGPFIISIFMVLPVIYEGLINGINVINKDITDDLALLPVNIKVKLIDVYIPMIKPFIIVSIIQALGMSFKVLIMGEYICQTPNSIGQELYIIKTDLDIAMLLAYGILIVIVVTILEIVVNIKTSKK